MNGQGERYRSRAIGAAMIAVALLSSGGAAADDPRQPVFRAIARELVAGIDGASVQDVPAAAGYGRPRVAVAPFRIDDSGISPDAAAEFNSWLLSELTREGASKYRFVARDTLRGVIRDIDMMAELDSDADAEASRLLRNARIDILIVGTLRKDGPAARVSYKAVSVEDGIVFAATQPRWIALAAPPHMFAQDRAVPMPQPAVARDGLYTPPPRRPVYLAQRALSMLGYDPGPVDGVMRPALRRAIGDFQRNIRVTVTGRLTRPLMRQLNQELQAEGKTALALY